MEINSISCTLLVAVALSYHTPLSGLASPPWLLIAGVAVRRRYGELRRYTQGNRSLVPHGHHDGGVCCMHQQGLRHAAFILRHCARHWHGRGHYMVHQQAWPWHIACHRVYRGEHLAYISFPSHSTLLPRRGWLCLLPVCGSPL